MRTAIYHGEEANIGRHGIINDGEPIQFLETELHGVIEDPRFEFLPDESQPGDVVLRATPLFDLRTINWGLPVLELDRRLCGLGGTELDRIVEAMELLGCFMPVKGVQAHFLSDSVIVEARRNGWTNLTPEEIVTSPGVLSVVVEETEPELTDEEIEEADRAHAAALAEAEAEAAAAAEAEAAAQAEADAAQAEADAAQAQADADAAAEAAKEPVGEAAAKEVVVPARKRK